MDGCVKSNYLKILIYQTYYEIDPYENAQKDLPYKTAR